MITAQRPYILLMSHQLGVNHKGICSPWTIDGVEASGNNFGKLITSQYHDPKEIFWVTPLWESGSPGGDPLHAIRMIGDSCSRAWEKSSSPLSSDSTSIGQLYRIANSGGTLAQSYEKALHGQTSQVYTVLPCQCRIDSSAQRIDNFLVIPDS